MTKVNQTCGTCGGTGIIHNWIVEKGSGNYAWGLAKSEDVKCTACDGKGYTEYAMFTPEEAKQIMKVCGLSTES
jgi:hypothetical protein